MCHKKYIIVCVIILILIIGGLLGYIIGYKYSTSIATDTHTNNLSSPTAPLSNGRNTYVVQAVKKASPSVVGITTQISQRDIFNRSVVVGEGVGSGVIYNHDGYIITNNHVIEGATNHEVTVTLSNGSSVTGTVIGSDEETDLAVVKIDTSQDVSPIELGNSEALQVGEPAIAIGNPLGLEFQGSVTTGVISAVQRTIDAQGQRFPLIQTDAAINPGNSGGALINADGQLIGINSSKIAKTGIEGMGFAIPINQAKKIVDEIIAHGKVIRPYLGLWAIDKETAKQYNIPFNDDGLLIAKLDTTGPAAKAGLRPGDIIINVDNKAILNLIDLKGILDSHMPGDTLSIQFKRDHISSTINVTIDELTK